MPPEFSSTYGVVQVHVYRGTNYSGGVGFDVINPNTESLKGTSDTIINQVPNLAPNSTIRAVLLNLFIFSVISYRCCEPMILVLIQFQILLSQIYQQLFFL